MRPWVDLVGVHTRTARDIELLGGRFKITSRDSFAGVDPGSIDAIVVAVGIRQVPAVLRSLTPLSGDRITLMLDTPILDVRDLGATRHFSRYGRILASEDSFALPPYVLARKLISDGTIGRLRHVHLLHSGYRHHALASLRQVTGGSPPTRISIRRWNRWCARLTARFPGGTTSTIIEPRLYQAGRMTLIGDRGFIVDYPMGHQDATEIGYQLDGGRFVGLTVDGDPVPPTDLDRAMAEGLRGAELTDGSLMSLLKIRGFMSLLAGLGDQTPDWRYTAYDALQDSLSLRLAERLHFLKDFRLGGNATVLGGAIRAAAGVARIASPR